MRFLPDPRPTRAILAALGLLAILGCGDDGLAKRYAVSGRVTFKGTPVSSGTITFVPEDSKAGRTATAVITDGSYKLTTLTPGDGAFPGKYQVSVVARDADTSEVAKAPNSLRRIKQIAAANLKARSILPEKYATPSTSGLTREVLAQSNQIDFELTD
jgi:hypothetical protein